MALSDLWSRDPMVLGSHAGDKDPFREPFPGHPLDGIWSGAGGTFPGTFSGNLFREPYQVGPKGEIWQSIGQNN